MVTLPDHNRSIETKLTHWDTLGFVSLCKHSIGRRSHPDLPQLWPMASLWRHQMETFSALLDLCEGNPLVTGGFPSQRPVTRSFDVYFDLCPNKRLSKQSRRWWFETRLRSLWRHCKVINRCHHCFGDWHQTITWTSGDLSFIKYLTPWGRDKMVDIFQTTFLNALFFNEIVVFWCKFPRICSPWFN